MDKKQELSKRSHIARKPQKKGVHNLFSHQSLPRPGQHQRFVADKLQPNDIIDLQRTIGMRATHNYLSRQIARRASIQRAMAISQASPSRIQRFEGSPKDTYIQLLKTVMATPHVAKMSQRELYQLIYDTYSLEGGEKSTNPEDEKRSNVIQNQFFEASGAWKKTVKVDESIHFIRLWNNSWDPFKLKSKDKKRMVIHAKEEAMFPLMETLATKILPAMPFVEQAKLEWHWEKMFQRFDSIVIYYVETGESEKALLSAIEPFRGGFSSGTPAMMQPSAFEGVATAEDTGGSFGEARADSIAKALFEFYQKGGGSFEEGLSWVTKALSEEGYNVEDLSKTKGEPPKKCFLTTACVMARGLPDDCEELTILRRFRDGYMRALPQGEALIREYYQVAPPIVAQIDQRPDSDEIYEGIYAIIQSCIRAIRADKPVRALAEYQQMVWDLQAKYVGGTYG